MLRYEANFKITMFIYLGQLWNVIGPKGKINTK